MKIPLMFPLVCGLCTIPLAAQNLKNALTFHADFDGGGMPPCRNPAGNGRAPRIYDLPNSWFDYAISPPRPRPAAVGWVRAGPVPMTAGRRPESSEPPAKRPQTCAVSPSDALPY